MFIEVFKSVDDIVKEYGGTRWGADADETPERDAIQAQLKDATIHLAWYGYGSYCGESLVIYEKDGRLYEVNASHCSCYGLKGQWKPEETSWAALAKRKIYDGCDGSTTAQSTLQSLVAAHTAQE